METNMRKTAAFSAVLALFGCNAYALIDINLTPNTPWDVGAGSYVSEGIVGDTNYVVQNAGESVRFNIRGTDSQNWHLGETPGLDTFAMKWSILRDVPKEEMFPIRTFDTVLNDNNASWSFFLRYYPPRYLSSNVGQQTSKVIVTALSSFIGSWSAPLTLSQESTLGGSDGIAVSKNGEYFHLAYKSNGLLRYAKWAPGGPFEDQEVVPGGGEAKVALDSAGNPNILHIEYAGGANNLKYSRFNGTAWTNTTVDSGVNALSLAIDSSNGVHAVYRKNTEVFYSVFNGTEWSSPADIGECKAPYIQVGPDDLPQMVCSNEGVAYAKWSASLNSWGPLTKITNGTNMGEYPVLRVDSSNNPHIVFWDSPGTVRYGHLNNGLWAFQAVAPNAEGYILELDSVGSPHIVYASPDEGIVYKRWVGTEWLPSTVQSSMTDSVLGFGLNSVSKPQVFLINNGSLTHSGWQ
ncbi:MAG: hypothetical protein HY952_10910 [Elusimicrobia bacterium]|nr:hypothetical protein [Elusimicrobiota bacterium]